MTFVSLMAAAAAGAEAANPYGFWEALAQGGVIAYATFGILVLMSVGSFYILFTKLFEQQKIINQGKMVRSSFWNAPTGWRTALPARRVRSTPASTKVSPSSRLSVRPLRSSVFSAPWSASTAR
jgi:hypothetical protein